ncbi:S-acyl fatty acid synthase thioesterase, medium chain-like [Babylonia areolata]|uniref:S-acyl fatty acid synthase thioesterase, medium chain-like n=1 Tax=Babylonia areolata TaxID=304850 RepID=UPI003FD4CCE2
MTSELTLKRFMNCRFLHPEATHRLFCFPWAGGGSNFYAAWGRALPANIEVYGITLAGRESRFKDEPCTSAQKTVDQISKTIVSEFGDKPFIFFGHSMGSLLCYETAVLLKKHHGLQAERMYLSGVSAPHSQSRRVKSKEFSAMTDEEFKDHLKKLGGTPPEVLQNQELMSLFLPAMKADYTMVAQMAYDKPEGCPFLSCDFTFFDGADDSDHDYDSWKELTEGSFTLHKLPGGHFYLKDDNNRQKILDVIQQDFPAAV